MASWLYHPHNTWLAKNHLMPCLFVLLLSLITLLQGCATKTPAFTTDSGQVIPNSIASLEPVTLGGHQQWLLIRGVNQSKPILLFLHGGPGSPYMGFAHQFQQELEKHFVVVQWDQRGSGKSFPNTPPASMTVQQFQADTHELVLLLQKRFQREKIYLLGHSWGSYLGLMEAKNHPENLYAYIGAGQMIDLIKQEQLSHDFVVAQATAANNRKALRQMQEIGYPPYVHIEAGMDTKYSWLWQYGGMLDGETGPYPFVKALITAKEYSWLDVSRFVKGGSFSLHSLAANEGKNFWQLHAPNPQSGFAVPVFFITGEHDHVTPTALIEQYTHDLNAPLKNNIIIPQAGHFAFFTHPQLFAAAVVNICQQTYPPSVSSIGSTSRTIAQMSDQ